MDSRITIVVLSLCLAFGCLVVGTRAGILVRQYMQHGHALSYALTPWTACVSTGGGYEQCTDPRLGRCAAFTRQVDLCRWLDALALTCTGAAALIGLLQSYLPALAAHRAFAPGSGGAVPAVVAKAVAAAHSALVLRTPANASAVAATAGAVLAALAVVPALSLYAVRHCAVPFSPMEEGVVAAGPYAAYHLLSAVLCAVAVFAADRGGLMAAPRRPAPWWS
jgi:hypothetical protein